MASASIRDTTLRLIAGMADGDQKFDFIKLLYERGELDDHNLYELLVQSIENNPRYYFEKITNSDLLTYMWRRFQAFPEALAQALISVAPEIFYGDIAWITRLVIQLQHDMKLNAELGVIVVRPGRGGGGVRRAIEVDDDLLKAIPRDVEELDINCRIRDLLYWYSRDYDMGSLFAQERMDEANNDYERRVWETARTRVQSYFLVEYSGAIKTINGRLFPAVHVRWWIENSRDQVRVLNIGDTGTYKTSYGTIAVIEAGCKQTIVFCAPGARKNWKKELELTYPRLREFGRIHVIDSAAAARFIPSNAEFIIVGYSNLTSAVVVAALMALDFDGVIWDESHYTKNVTGATAAKRSLNFLRIVQPAQPRLKKLVASTATPYENSAEEIAVLACVLRPDIFADPIAFLKSGAYASPRFLRALLEICILDIALHEVRDLPEITPKPWEDLFGAVPLVCNGMQAKLYAHMISHEPDLGSDDDEIKKVNGVDGSGKIRHLLYAADMPNVLKLMGASYDWPTSIEAAFDDWELSTKLVWLKQQLDARVATEKICVASGLYVQGVTKPVNGQGDDIIWIGKLLKEWYGDDAVLILDGSVWVNSRKRERIIDRWREDPIAKIFLISQKTCPDSINLSVTIQDDPSVQNLHLIALSQDWKPWKQFVGRFWREGLSVTMSYDSPVLAGTADEARYELNSRKWRSLQLFKSRVPPTQAEWRMYMRSGGERMSDLMRSPGDWVSLVNNDMRGVGERRAQGYLESTTGLSTYAEVFARSFLEIQSHSASGHIARHMTRALRTGLAATGVLDDPELILDAGCGPATMARFLDLPIVGVDQNPWMVQVAQDLNPVVTARTQVMAITQIPEGWDGRFKLTMSSMVLDWAELDLAEAEPERLSILNRLIDVTDPHGLIWLTFNRSSMDKTQYAAWMKLLTDAKYQVFPLSGQVVPKGQGEKKTPAFSFWSILFSPNGSKLRITDAKKLILLFETTRLKHKKPSTRKPPKGPEKPGPLYNDFEILNPLARNGAAVEDSRLIRQTLLAHISATHRHSGRSVALDQTLLAELFGTKWRVLEDLRRRKFIHFASRATS